MKKRYWLVPILCGAAFLIAPMAVAGELKGALTADREIVRVGEVVKLLLTISGSGPADSYEIDQPVFPKLKNLSLIEISQRNEIARCPGGESFSTHFLYVFKIKKPGEEKIPAIQVKYRKKGEDESQAVKVEGLKITLKKAEWGRAAILGLAIIIVGLGIILVVIFRRRKRIVAEKPLSRVSEEKVRKSDDPVKALGSIEEARRQKIAGDPGAFCSEVVRALKVYHEKERDAEIEGFVRKLENLCERVNYGRDEVAEREIDELVRKAELCLNKKIREELTE